jgi:DNA-nicking Smr family endonuclease
MKKKKSYPEANNAFDAELIKMYMTGAINPGQHQERKYSADTIDLHLDQHTLSQKGVLPQNALLYQINECEKAIDKAIAAQKTEIRLIHGLGSGKLKNAVAGLLKKHPQVKSFEQKFHPKHGDGSTLIFFK